MKMFHSKRNIVEQNQFDVNNLSFCANLDVGFIQIVLQGEFYWCLPCELLITKVWMDAPR